MQEPEHDESARPASPRPREGKGWPGIKMKGSENLVHQPTTTSSPGGTIEVSVLAAGKQQPFCRRSDGHMFIPGIPGNAYTLRVRNKTGVRTEVIATVDGRHVLKDEPGDPHACRGLVIPAGQTYEFRGWRVSDGETREFLFGEPAASVAVQATGSTANIGVIGFAAWREREASFTNYGMSGGSGYQSRSVVTATAAASSYSTANVAGTDVAHGSIGTGIGAYQDDRVGRTDFTRTGEPDILVIGYDTEAELIRRGILGPAGPDAFPGHGTGYEKYRTA